MGRFIPAKEFDQAQQSLSKPSTFPFGRGFPWPLTVASDDHYFDVRDPPIGLFPLGFPLTTNNGTLKTDTPISGTA